ncbi:hypothetical protein [Lactobacillus taiwanensis]|uniref:hypothetical protein n=1 Tax=Lactobacillus taiwanensis TaxID=508451 RepID=UPI0025AA011B|nr:hypothetical protein [Lactobacillus taiwanensis]
MIIGVDYFGYDWNGTFYDTPIPTAGIDEVTMYEGLYDELFVSLDTTIDETPKRPEKWHIKTIMDAKFNNSLEAGTITGSEHIVNNIQVFRREYQNVDTNWKLIAQFPYEQKYNMYTIIDRFIENGKTYEYAIVPLAKDVMGDVTISEPIYAEFTGTYISDLDSNYEMNLDFKFGDMTHNKTSSVAVPLNSEFPIVTFGNQNYRTGNITFLPLTKEQELGMRTKISPKAELENRKRIIDFLNNGSVKVIRRDDGDVLVVATNDIKETPKSDAVDAISNVTFNFTEVGNLDYDTMEKSGLIAGAGKSIYTFDEFGEVVWDNERVNEEARREYRNSFADFEKKGSA